MASFLNGFQNLYELNTIFVSRGDYFVLSPKGGGSLIECGGLIEGGGLFTEIFNFCYIIYRIKWANMQFHRVYQVGLR